jgi:hypothetical protein
MSSRTIPCDCFVRPLRSDIPAGDSGDQGGEKPAPDGANQLSNQDIQLRGSVLRPPCELSIWYGRPCSGG